MSAKQVSLKSPLTIAVVMVLLVGVVFLNVKTFGGKGPKAQGGYRVQAHPPVPLDASRVVCFMEQPGELGSKTASVFSVKELKRDPFIWGKAQPNTMVLPNARGTKKTKTARRKTKSLECSAIMLGGLKSMAIIDGEGYHLGDKIRGMLLTAIDADGVTLRKADGSTTHLTVGVQQNKDKTFRVVTRGRQSEDLGRTRLVDQ